LGLNHRQLVQELGQVLVVVVMLLVVIEVGRGQDHLPLKEQVELVQQRLL
jgi:hypothetical protein